MKVLPVLVGIEGICRLKKRTKLHVKWSTEERRHVYYQYVLQVCVGIAGMCTSYITVCRNCMYESDLHVSAAIYVSVPCLYLRILTYTYL